MAKKMKKKAILWKVLGCLVMSAIVMSAVQSLFIFSASAVPIIPSPGVDTDKSSICCGDYITVNVPVKNLKSVSKTVSVHIVIKDPNGNTKASTVKTVTISAHGSTTVTARLKISKPCNYFGTYTVKATVKEGSTVHDTDTTTFKVNDCEPGSCRVYVEIEDPCCVGYRVYVDGDYQFTEGQTGTPDGYCAFYVDEGTHTLKITKNSRSATKTINFKCNIVYRWVYMPKNWCGDGKVYVEIKDKYCKGYEVYVDGNYQFTEGQTGTPDGNCGFFVGVGTRTIEIRKNGRSADLTKYFECGYRYTWDSMPKNWCEPTPTPPPQKPAPEIIKVEYPTACVNEGEEATISVTVENKGGKSSEGYISVSFPNDEDVYVVSGTGNEYNKVYPKGSEIWGKEGKIPSSKDPLVELFDTNWGKYQQETITMKAKPNSGSDKIEFLVRAALKNDADGSYERDPTYSSYKDQQGWYVKKYSVDVCEYEKVKFRGKILVDNQIISFYSFDIKIDEVIDDPTGNLQKGETVNVYGHRDGPAHVDDVTVGDEVEVYGEYRGYVGRFEQIFLSDYGESSSDHYVKKIEEKPAPEIIKVEYPTKCVKEGDDATISVTVENKGGTSNEGYISVSFPNDEDVSVVSGTGNGYNKLYPKGSEIWGKDGKIPSSKDPLVDLLDTNWVKDQQETITMNVKPNSGSDEIVFYVRTALKNADGSYERDPTYSGYKDQQGWYVERHVVDVCPKEACVIIDDDTCVGYEVYVDAVHILTEGVGETLDGSCTFYVAGGTHTIEIRNNECFASITRNFQSDTTYRWDSMPKNWCKCDAEVKFKGVIVKDSSTSSFFNYKIKINDVLTDPSDVLNPGDEIWIWAVSGGSSQVDSVGIDDKVEVYGTYDGELHREVKLETAEHTLKKDNYETTTFTNTIGMEFVLIPAGEFEMGSPPDEAGRDSNEGPVHHVTLGYAFYMGRYEVTQQQWREIMGDNPSYFKGDDLPVELVSWDDAQNFIKKLNEKEGTDKYRLPSEAEWEYACRAGTTTRYSFGDDESKLGEYAWYLDNSGGKTHPVGQKKPNPWGLYDMHGNVWEWVQDCIGRPVDYNGAPTDGSAWVTSPDDPLSIRSGGWTGSTINCRSADRYWGSAASCTFGFRLVSSLPTTAEVKFRGVIVKESLQTSFYIYKIKIDEILMDPSDVLNSGDEIWVFSSGPATVDDVSIGDKVEVYGKYDGELHREVKLETAEHYLKNSEKQLTITGGSSDYEPPLQVFFQGSDVHVSVQNPAEYTYIVEYWEDTNDNLELDDNEWLRLPANIISTITRSDSEFDIPLPDLMPLGLYRIEIEGTDYVSNDFFVIFNPLNCGLTNEEIDKYWRSEVSGLRACARYKLSIIDMPKYVLCTFFSNVFNFLGLAPIEIKLRNNESDMLLIMAANRDNYAGDQQFGVLQNYESFLHEHMYSSPGARYPSDIKDYIDSIKDNFLIPGDCDCFATFLVGLARTSGIPARAITGLGKDKEGDNADHGWVEAYYNGGWQVWDPYNEMRFESDYNKYLRYFIQHSEMINFYTVVDEDYVDRSTDYGISTDLLFGELEQHVDFSDLHAYDCQGRHVGVDYASGNNHLEIPDAYYTDISFDTESITIFGQNEDILFQILPSPGENYCLFDLTIAKMHNKEVITVTYEDVPISKTEEATVKVSLKDNRGWLMVIKDYADGSQITRDPDSIDW